MKKTVKLTNFTQDEFHCKCGCGLNSPKDDDLVRLQSVRLLCNFALIVNSCCRCKKHNSNVGGLDDSEHLDCKGFDIKCTNSHERFILVSALINCGFNRIGIYENFIHAGTDLLKPQMVMWFGK
jgi:hypothetical protein